MAPEGRKLGSLKRRMRCHLVARSAFRSQNVQNTPWSDHFWKLRCRKSARRCGAKHISKLKCTKQTFFGLFLKLRCRKSARRPGAKHISKSKCTKHTRSRALFEVEMPAVARSTFPSQKWKKTKGFGTLLDVWMSFCVAGTKDSAPCQKWGKREGFVAFSKTMAGVDIWRGSGKMHFAWQTQYKRHVHQRC